MNPTTDKPLPLPPSRGRRALMLAAAAVGAGAGIGLALRSQRQAQPVTTATAEDSLWGLQWQTPQGQVLQMRSFKGRPLLLNFWATWCPPCVQELPLLNAFYRQNASAGWQVLGLAMDGLAPVQDFLKKLPLDFPVALAGLPGVELSRNLGNLSGGLPFSVVMGTNGKVLHRKMGQVSEADLEAWVRLK